MTLSIADIATSVFSHPTFKGLTAFALYIFTYLFGKGDMFTSVAVPILILLATDAITRGGLAIQERVIDDSILKASCKKLFVYSAYIIMARVVDQNIPGGYDAVTFAMKSFIIGTECTAIINTLGKLGFPLPPKLLKYFKDFTDDGKAKLNDTNTNSDEPK